MRTPPATATWYAGTFPGQPDQVRHVRHAVARHLTDCPAADEAVLIASELAANAALSQPGRVLHRPRRGVSRLRLGRGRGSGRPLDCRQPDDRPHGLDVIEALTGPDGWGVETTTGGSRVVWVRLDLPPGDHLRSV